MKKPVNLQPYLDYFGMLRQYEISGFIEVMPDKHEAYITRAALHTLAPLREAVPQVARHIRAYAAWEANVSDSSQPGIHYSNAPFALHVVQEDAPHDLLYTLLLTRRRRWFSPWRKSDSIEVITYNP